MDCCASEAQSRGPIVIESGRIKPDLLMFSAHNEALSCELETEGGVCDTGQQGAVL